MKVSVILTTYNKEDELGRVLEGLALQSTLAHEVIVGDDGSGPATKELVSGFQRDFPCRLLHVWQEDKGFRAAKSRNSALRESSGDYIVMLDGDCLVPRHFVEDHARLAEKGYFVQGKRVLVAKDAAPLADSRMVNSPLALLMAALTGKISNSHHILRLPLFFAFRNKKLRGIKTCNFGVYREDAVSVNGFNEEFVGWGREDSEFAARLFNYGLMRKEHSFMAICFHLWHEEARREGLRANEEILQRAISSGSVRCQSGIDQSGPERDRKERLG